jgi:hypothetical protein
VSVPSGAERRPESLEFCGAANEESGVFADALRLLRILRR